MARSAQQRKENIRLQTLIVVLSVVLMAGKFIAWALTHSNAILTDALESIINILAASFALYSLVLSAKPKDENHPYGHGKIEFISASVEGTFIVIAGVAIIIKSGNNLFRPVALQQLDVGILLILATGIVNYAVGWITEKRGHKVNSMTLVAGGKHLKTDAYSTAGLIIGLLIIYVTNLLWLDSIVAIIFGGIICYSGYKILRASLAGIMDEADYELLKEIVAVLNKHRRPNWIDIHNLRVIKYGSTLHIDCHLTVPHYLTVMEAHAEVKAIEDIFRENTERSIELFIHTDPCIVPSCKVCEKMNCSHRQFTMEKRPEWKFEDVIRNAKHGI